MTPPDPNLFYRAASELVCEAVAAKVVDGPAATNLYTSATGSAAAMTDMVGKVMGLPASDPHYAGALKALQDHYNAAVAARSTHDSVVALDVRGRLPIPHARWRWASEQGRHDTRQSTTSAAHRTLRHRLRRPARGGDAGCPRGS